MMAHGILDFAVAALNSLAMLSIAFLLARSVARIEKKLDYTLSYLRWVKARHDTTHLYTLHRLLAVLLEEERYEEAAKVREMIDRETEDAENDGKASVR